nr:molybdopterin cofactor-binding domain-containing protein [Prosthecomicrobium pneumaticum]
MRPATLAEAVAAAAMPGAVPIGGATALQLDWAAGAARPGLLVDLTRCAALSGSGVEPDGGLRIGAAARLAALEHDPHAAAGAPLLLAALRSVAAPPIRTRATLGGNIAGRTGCLIPALLALDAALVLASAAGERTVPLAAWLAAPPAAGEIVVAVLLPKPSPRRVETARKIGRRAAFTPSVIGVAASLDIGPDGRIGAARLAVGGGPNRPRRLAESEALLVGCDVGAADWHALRGALLEEIDAADDGWRSRSYRRRVAAHAIVAGLGGAFPPHPGPLPAGGERGQGRALPVKGVRAEDRAIPLPLAGEGRVRALPEEVEVSHRSLGDRWRIRPDVQAKVEGGFRYLTEHRAPDMLIGRILRAGRPHARIRAIDVGAAEALPGVRAVVTAADVKGENAFGIVVQDQPALAADRVRFAGEPVAALAAVDAATAERALSLIRVDYEDLPVVTDPEAALAEDAPRVHEGGNLLTDLHFVRGDLAGAWEGCAHIVEATYLTPRQMHGFMETEGGFARPELDGGLSVFAGGQYALRDRMQLARILGLPEEKIRVVTSPTGGAFGGKDELTVQPALALLALKSGRPVRLQLDRAESVLSGWKRHPMTIRMRTGCDAAGRLVAQQVDVVADAGAYASLGPGVLETALEHACGPYGIPHVETRGRLVYTNNGLCGAFRGFGANQMTYAIECQIGRLAERAGLDPFEMRRRALRRPGTPGYLGQTVGPSERLDEMLAAAEASALWAAPRGLSGDGAMITGIGFAMNYQGTGLGSIPPDPGGGRLALAPDGKIEAAFGFDEMGQGALAMIQAVVAGALGCDRDDVRPIVGDTALTPESGSTTAARATFVAWKTARTAGPALAADLVAAAALRLGRDPADLAVAPGGIRDRRANDAAPLIGFAELAASLDPLPQASAAFEFPKTDYTRGNARFLFISGATLARVAIDRVTGMVRVTDIEQHAAAGPIVDPAGYLGQIEGGAVQGLGFTLTEDMRTSGGVFLEKNLDQYLMPSIADAPERMTTFALEDLDPGDPFGPRGVGELGIGAVTPAIAAAIADATGLWPATTPIAPEAVLDALEGAG